MNIKRIAKFTLLILLVAALGTVTGTLFGNTRIKRSFQKLRINVRISSQVAAAFQAAPKTYKEYTIVTQEDQINAATGERIEVSFRTTRAQRSDGTRALMREVHLTRKDTPITHKREITYPDSRFVTLFDDVKLRSSSAAFRGSVFIWGSRLSPESDCTSRRENFIVDGKRETIFKLIGKETVNGFAVSKLQTGNGELLWLSPDLDCEAVGLEVPDTAETRKEQCAQPGVITKDHLITVTTGTPDPALFDESCCVEVRPSQAWSEQAAFGVQLTGGSIVEVNQARLDILNDPEYQRKDKFWSLGH